MGRIEKQSLIRLLTFDLIRSNFLRDRHAIFYGEITEIY